MSFLRHRYHLALFMLSDTQMQVTTPGSVLRISAAPSTVHSHVGGHRSVCPPEPPPVVQETSKDHQQNQAELFPTECPVRGHIAEGQSGLFCPAPSPLCDYVPLLLSVVTVMMWPLAVYHRLWDRACVRLKPALQRLDFSVRGYMMSKQRERQRKCPGEASFHLGSLGKRRKSP